VKKNAVAFLVFGKNMARKKDLRNFLEKEMPKRGIAIKTDANCDANLQIEKALKKNIDYLLEEVVQGWKKKPAPFLGRTLDTALLMTFDYISGKLDKEYREYVKKYGASIGSDEDINIFEKAAAMDPLADYSEAVQLYENNLRYPARYKYVQYGDDAMELYFGDVGDFFKKAGFIASARKVYRFILKKISPSNKQIKEDLKELKQEYKLKN